MKQARYSVIICLLVGLLFVSCDTGNSTSEEDDSLAAVDSIQTVDTTQIVEDRVLEHSFTWNTELCANHGIYDPSQVTELQLKNTYDFWFKDPYYIQTDATVREPGEVGKLDIKVLKQECATKLAKLKALDIIPSPFWQKEKEKKIRQIELLCQLKEATTAGYKNPALLKQFTLADSCFHFADALVAGGDVLLAAWKAFAEKRCESNGSPQQCQERFLEMYNSPQRLEYARVEMMTYGWWNCANHTVQSTDNYVQLEEEFNKQFKNIQSECDEP